jgi:hypothetical protein
MEFQRPSFEEDGIVDRSSETGHACAQFELDMCGSNYGVCKCGFSKVEHLLTDNSAVPSKDLRIHKRPSLSSRSSEEHDIVDRSSETAACAQFELDMCGSNYGVCKCGFSRLDHGAVPNKADLSHWKDANDGNSDLPPLEAADVQIEPNLKEQTTSAAVAPALAQKLEETKSAAPAESSTGNAHGLADELTTSEKDMLVEANVSSQQKHQLPPPPPPSAPSALLTVTPKATKKNKDKKKKVKKKKESVEAAPEILVYDVVFSSEGKLGITWGRAPIVRIQAVLEGSYAARLGVDAGDVLVKVNGQALTADISAKDFKILMLGLTRPFILSFSKNGIMGTPAATACLRKPTSAEDNGNEQEQAAEAEATPVEGPKVYRDFGAKKISCVLLKPYGTTPAVVKLLATNATNGEGVECDCQCQLCGAVFSSEDARSLRPTSGPMAVGPSEPSAKRLWGHVRQCNPEQAKEVYERMVKTSAKQTGRVAASARKIGLPGASAESTIRSNSKCQECGTEYFSASGTSTLCLTCRKSRVSERNRSSSNTSSGGREGDDGEKAGGRDGDQAAEDEEKEGENGDEGGCGAEGRGRGGSVGVGGGVNTTEAQQLRVSSAQSSADLNDQSQHNALYSTALHGTTVPIYHAEDPGTPDMSPEEDEDDDKDGQDEEPFNDVTAIVPSEGEDVEYCM